MREITKLCWTESPQGLELEPPPPHPPPHPPGVFVYMHLFLCFDWGFEYLTFGSQNLSGHPQMSITKCSTSDMFQLDT